jgi:CO/xanthine dehydrogenase Mo-binding subunit
MSRKSIGQSTARVDARGKVTGATPYSGDLSMPGMLHMKMLFAERPHARVKSIQTGAAEAAPGVVAVFTSKDVPVNEYGLQWQDQPVLCGPSATPPQGVSTDIVRFEGDQVAAVVAETEAAAAEAVKLIEVEYEDLPLVSDAVEAMKPGAPQLHPERGDSNVCVHYKIRKGEWETSLSKADVIVEGEYKTPYQEHAFLQPEAGLAYTDEEGRITVVAGGQWTHTDVREIAHCLALPEEKVRVIYPAIGGAFGGREDMSVQIVIALAAWKLQRPVRIIWTRRESIIGHGKRHPTTIKAKWGATKDGKLVAAEIELIGDGGAYMYTSNKVLGNSAITCTGPYFIPNLKADVFGVYTNNVPGAAFRGFGAPQALYMAELQMDKLAEKLGLDPLEFRLKNALRDGDTLGVGTPAPGPVSIVKVMEEIQKQSSRARVRLRGGIQKRGIQFWLPGKLLGQSGNPRERTDRKSDRPSRGRGGGTGDAHRDGADGGGGGGRERGHGADADFGYGHHAKFRVGLGLAHDLHGWQRHQRCGGSGAGKVERGGAACDGRVQISRAEDDSL